MYKIGLLYNICGPITTDINVVLCYAQDHFEVKYIRDQRITDILCKQKGGITSIPVLFDDDKNYRISSYHLLTEINYAKSEEELSHVGLELLAADSHVSYTDKNQGKLYLNGIEICDENQEYYFETRRTGIASSGPSVVTLQRRNRSILDYSEIVSNIILRIYCLGKVVNELKLINNLNLFFNIKDLRRKRLKENNWMVLISEYKSYLDTINIQEIMRSYKVSYSDFYSSRYDEYRVYREAETACKNAYNDIYLKELLGLGGEMIFEGDYSSKVNIKMGECQGKDLEKEKEKIISEYSKEVHMACLIASDLHERNLNQAGIRELETQLKALNDLLFKFFKLETLDERDFYVFGNRYDAIHDDRSNFEEKIEELNAKYKSLTLIDA